MKVKTSPYLELKSAWGRGASVNTHFFLAIGEEFKRVHSVCDRASNDWEQMKNYWWFILAFEQSLLQNVCEYGQDRESDEADDKPGGRLGQDIPNSYGSIHIVPILKGVGFEYCTFRKRETISTEKKIF